MQNLDNYPEMFKSNNGLEVRFKTLSSISASMCILDNRLLLQLDYQTFEIPKYYAICTQNPRILVQL